MIRSVCFFVLFALASAASLSLENEWRSFKAEHNKIYASANEESLRKSIFAANLKEIEAHNKEADKGVYTFRLGVNKFTDLTTEEFKATYTGFQRPARRQSPLIHNDDNTKGTPASVDWRDTIVVDVKDQGQCGSCWAFSTTAAIEGAHAQKTGKLVSLSEQNLMDCSWKYKNSGCNGGLPDFAFQYVKDNKGIDTEASYPYKHRSSHTCKYNNSSIGATISSFVDIPEGKEDSLLVAVAKRVVSVGVSANDMHHYHSGILQAKTCHPEKLDHGVAIVGYGTEDGTPFWIVRNSWGARWGEKGYVRFYRGANTCGIAESASYPLV